MLYCLGGLPDVIVFGSSVRCIVSGMTSDVIMSGRGVRCHCVSEGRQMS